MLYIIILSKLAVFAVYSLIILNIYKFKKEDSTVKLELDLLSRIEFMAGIGLALISIISVITPETYSFTLGLCLLSTLIGYFHKNRLILAGNKNVMLKGKIYPIKDIQKLSTGMLSLHVQLKKQSKKLSIYVPLTSNNILKNKVEAKIKK